MARGPALTRVAWAGYDSVCQRPVSESVTVSIALGVRVGRAEMAPRTNRATAARTPLSRERVLRAAIAFADEGGIGSLSMRKLGDFTIEPEMDAGDGRAFELGEIGAKRVTFGDIG